MAAKNRSFRSMPYPTMDGGELVYDKRDLIHIMENISVFDIPLLSREVTQRLSNHDLAQCCLVSKQWFEWFIPSLWHTISIRRSIAASPGLRHQAHVRNILDIGLREAVESHHHWSFPALQSITLDFATDRHYPFLFIQSGGAYPMEIKILRMLETSPSLRSLNMCLPLNDVNVHSQFLRTLQSLHYLQKVQLECKGCVNPVHMQQIIETCRHCVSLRLYLGDCWGDCVEIGGKEKYALAKSGLEKMPDTQFRELFFRSSALMQGTHILAPLLQCSPLLESLYLEMCHITSPKQLCDTFQSRRYPRLKVLHLGRSSDFADLLHSIGSDDDNDYSDIERVGLETLE